MKHIVIRERGHLHRLPSGQQPPASTMDEAWLEEALYDRLQFYDLSSDDKPIFEWRAEKAYAGQWVGVIQLPGLLVELLPKIDDHPNHNATTLARSNLAVMLLETGKVPLRARDLASLHVQKTPLHEMLILLFVRELRLEFQRGLDRGYIEHNEDVRMLRGKLQLSRHLTKNIARRDRFSCAFDEFSVDTPLNRIFKACCHALLRRSESAEVATTLHYCLMRLDEVQDTHNPVPLLEGILFTRRNARFKTLFEFARMVLERDAPDVAHGDRQVFSLLFDMDALFEGFIASMLQRSLRIHLPDAHVIPQSKRNTRHLMREGSSGVLRMHPDILVVHERHHTVVDTKWKRLCVDGELSQRGVDAPDLYQMYAYTHRFEVNGSVLLYPKTEGCTERTFELLEGDETPSSPFKESRDTRCVHVRFVDLHRDLRNSKERERLHAELADIILDVSAMRQGVVDAPHAGFIGENTTGDASTNGRV